MRLVSEFAEGSADVVDDGFWVLPEHEVAAAGVRLEVDRVATPDEPKSANQACGTSNTSPATTTPGSSSD
jgi:hypothetical protein